jgi:hypothetical protein
VRDTSIVSCEAVITSEDSRFWDFLAMLQCDSLLILWACISSRFLALPGSLIHSIIYLERTGPRFTGPFETQKVCIIGFDAVGTPDNSYFHGFSGYRKTTSFFFWGPLGALGTNMDFVVGEQPLPMVNSYSTDVPKLPRVSNSG